MAASTSGSLGLRLRDLPRIFEEVGKSLGMKIGSWREVYLDNSGSYATARAVEENQDERILGLKAYEIEGTKTFFLFLFFNMFASVPGISSSHMS